MYKLKPLARQAIPKALEKAERYRLLNEPEEAESICRDILAVDPENQPAIVTLVLSMTDQFRSGTSVSVTDANDEAAKLQGEYERLYYTAIISERRGNAVLDTDRPGSHANAYEYLRSAMDLYEQAEAIRPPNNDDPILRWNTCART